MPLSDTQLARLREALGRYDFPCWVWDGTPVEKTTTSRVERFIRSQLLSDDDRSIKMGLVSVVCWGWGGTALFNFRSGRAARFITQNHLDGFRAYRVDHPGGDILELSRLRIPELGRMAFGTKVLAFLNPRTRAVLDKKIAEILRETTFCQVFGPLPTGNSIPITRRTASRYNNWCNLCRIGAAQMGAVYRAVDFERAIFKLAQEDRQQTAISCVNAVVAHVPI